LNLDKSPPPSIDPNFVAGRLGDHAEASGHAGTPHSQNNSTNTRTALLDGRAPAKSSMNAPRGALADRNYQKTVLNVAQARTMINTYRRRNGLKPLALDSQLIAAAKAHSRDLAMWDRISHYGSDNSNLWDRVRRTGYKARLAVENVGTGQLTLREVFVAWKKSHGHDKNLLLTHADHMGIALIYDAKTKLKTFWTLILGCKR